MVMMLAHFEKFRKDSTICGAGGSICTSSLALGARLSQAGNSCIQSPNRFHSRWCFQRCKLELFITKYLCERCANLPRNVPFTTDFFGIFHGLYQIINPREKRNSGIFFL